MPELPPPEFISGLNNHERHERNERISYAKNYLRECRRGRSSEYAKKVIALIHWEFEQICKGRYREPDVYRQFIRELGATDTEIRWLLRFLGFNEVKIIDR